MYQDEYKAVAFPDDISTLLEMHYQQCKLSDEKGESQDKFRCARISNNYYVDVLDMKQYNLLNSTKEIKVVRSSDDEKVRSPNNHRFTSE